MPDDIYEVLALAARYWFVFLGVLIVWRSFDWLRKDRRAKHRRLKQLPDAGMVGELVVLRGSELQEGTPLPLPREGVLGRLRTCDLTVPDASVAPRHLDFVFEDGKGLLVYPRRGCSATVDGEEVGPRSKSSEHPLHHGSRLTVGECELRMRLFIGLETGGQAMVRPDLPDDGAVHQIPAAWEQTGRFSPVPTLPLFPPSEDANAPYGLDPHTGVPLSPYGLDLPTGRPFVPSANPDAPFGQLPNGSINAPYGFDHVTGRPVMPLADVRAPFGTDAATGQPLAPYGVDAVNGAPCWPPVDPNYVNPAALYGFDPLTGLPCPPPAVPEPAENAELPPAKAKKKHGLLARRRDT